MDHRLLHHVKYETTREGPYMTRLLLPRKSRRGSTHRRRIVKMPNSRIFEFFKKTHTGGMVRTTCTAPLNESGV